MATLINAWRMVWVGATAVRAKPYPIGFMSTCEGALRKAKRAVALVRTNRPTQKTTNIAANSASVSPKTSSKTKSGYLLY